MPGLSFVYNSDVAFKKELHEKHLSLLNELAVLPDYSSSLSGFGAHWSLYSFCYPEYPIAEYEVDDIKIYIEGKIYDKTSEQVVKELRYFTERYVNESATNDDLVKWTLETDGEYIIYIFHKPSDTILIFNDVFSHLKAYYTITDKSIYLSRSFRFTREASEINEVYDPVAMSLYLIFRFYPFNKTFLSNVKVLDPGSLIRIDQKQKSIQKSVIHTFNFDHKKYAGQSLKSCAIRLAEIQAESAKQRCLKDSENIMMLSGGMDSRAVAASLKRNNMPFRCISWLDHEETAKNDTVIAEKVATVLKTPWSVFRLPPTQGSDVFRLLQMNDGLIPLNLAHVHYMFEALIDSYSRSSQIVSGNFGWSLRYSLPSNPNITSVQDLVAYLLRVYSHFSLEAVSKLTGLKQTVILDEIIGALNMYPEANVMQKCAHFLTHERGLNGLILGGDRHRQYMWHTYPDLSLHFFQYAMNCPDRYKKNYRLYNRVLMELSKELGRIPRAVGTRYKYVQTPISKRVGHFCYLIDPLRLFKKYILKVTPKRRSNRDPDLCYPTVIKDILRQQLEHTPAIREIFLPEQIDNVFCDFESLTHIQKASLFTTFSAIEYCSLKSSEIEHHLNENMNIFRT